MTRSSHILTLMLAMLLMAFAGAGCVEPLHPDDRRDDRQGVRLPIQIRLPAGVMPATKAMDGPVRGLEKESALYSLQVWAFSHPYKPESELTEEEKEGYLNESAIAYINVSDVNVLNNTGEGATVVVSLFIPDYVLSRPDEKMKLDFYVLGNGESIGWNNAGVLKREAMRDAVFKRDPLLGVDYFGVNEALGAFDKIPTSGLPMSCFYDNRGTGFDISFLKTDPDPTDTRMEELGRVWPSMELTRSVSRMRFLFAQATGMTGNAIDSIKIFDFDNAADAGLIPEENYVFPRESAIDIALPDGVAYQSLEWGSIYSGLVGIIGQMDDPMVLCSNSDVMQGMSAQFFDTYVQNLLNQPGNKPTLKTLYLRESDRPIKGRIYYNGRRENGEIVTPSKSVDFSMVGLGFPDRTNFYRDHSWTVYAYMIGQHMQVDVRLDDWVVPWTREEVKINGEETVNVDQDGKFIPDPDAVMVADTLRDPISGAPLMKGNGKPQKKWFNVEVPAGDAGVTGRVVIYAPEGGKLIVTPVAVDTTEFYPRLTPEGRAAYQDPTDSTYVTNWFDISLTTDEISRTYVDPETRIPGLIGITIKRKNLVPGQGGIKAIKLSFAVKVKEGDRLISADSEIIDDEYHFFYEP